MADLVKLGLPSARYVETQTRRLPSVYPVFESATMEERRRLLEWGQTLGNLIPFGRQGFLVPDNLHHTLGMGWDLAESIGEETELNFDHWRDSVERVKQNIVED